MDCTGYHDELRNDEGRFRAELRINGELDDGVERLLMGTCRACGSTIALELPRGES
jgi:hypothetical protein